MTREQWNKNISLCQKGKHKLRVNKMGVTWCVRCGLLSNTPNAEPFYEWEDDMNTLPCLEEPDAIIPAWSLHRLIEMCPYVIRSLPALHLTMSSDSVFYCTEDNNEEYEKPFSRYTNMYDNYIECIEWLIKEGYFNKEYLN